MGVKGLWKLLDGTGRPVNLEALEGKILAVDISVWLNMAIKGMRDYHGHPSQTAHLTTLFNRICKLLYYGIKPVFVFDGQSPALKQNTLRERRERKDYNIRESRKASEKILQNYLKRQILQETIGKSSQDEKPGTSKSTDDTVATPKPSKVKHQEKDIYDLPPPVNKLEDSDEDDLEEELKMRTELQSEYLDDTGHIDVAGVLDMNIDSKDFDVLPSDVQYELLKDLKEIRKRRRTQLEKMPDESNSFSNYQIAGLLAKRKISKKMEFVENKMSEENLAASSQMSGLGDDLMKHYKVDARQLTSDSTSHYIWLRKLNTEKNGSDTKEAEKVDCSGSRALHVIVEETTSLASAERLSPQKKEIFPSVVSPLNADSSSPSTSETEVLFNKSKTQQEHQPTSPEPTKTMVQTRQDQSEIFPRNPNLSTTMDDKSSNINQHIVDDSVETPAVKANILDVNQNLNGSFNIPAKVPQDLDVLQRDDSKIGEAEHSASLLLEERKDDQSENPRSEQQTEKFVIEVPKIDSDDTSDDDFLDIPDQDYSNLPAKATADIANVCDSVVAATEQISEEYDSMDSNPWGDLNADNVENFANQLDAESIELKKMMQAKERAGRDLSQSAQLECQELLKLFGLPYLVSPQEAEAQCAMLELLGLTHGTITEDSDIWLFGGKYVVKDMFGKKNDPVAFNSADIETQLGLRRDRFICIALCAGSDYTMGIRGVGPVTAMEILKEFDGEGIQGLLHLRTWWDKVCSSVKQVVQTETKIKSQLRRVNLKKDFPSKAVYKAYMQPVVNDENEKFEWGLPDLDELRNFATGTMNWTKQKVNEVLLPVMKKLGQRRSSQSRMTQFIPLMSRTASKKNSKRVLRAAAVLTGKGDPAEKEITKKRPRKAKAKKVEAEVKLNLSESSSDD